VLQSIPFGFSLPNLPRPLLLGWDLLGGWPGIGLFGMPFPRQRLRDRPREYLAIEDPVSPAQSGFCFRPAPLNPAAFSGQYLTILAHSLSIADLRVGNRVRFALCPEYG
jgi:hypothetical protein